MNIREYRDDDLKSIVAIFRSNIPKYFVESEEDGLRDYLSNLNDEYYVVEQNGVIAAGGIGRNEDETVSLCWGMVRNDLIGTGIGKLLTQHRIVRSREKFGGRPLVVSTSQHTSGLYEKLGFVMIEHVPDGFAPGIDTCKMRLEFK